ncbi:MAG: DUF3267 domain-containing protein [Ruminococcus sp.]
MDLKNKICSSSLPAGYREIYSVNLQKDKKTALIVNIVALILMAIFVIIGWFIVPYSYTFHNDESIVTPLLKLIAVLAEMIVYLILHELVHGITMKHYGAKKVKYGFTGLYAFAGCEEYFSKKSYIVIALAPIVVWGIVLAVVCCFVPKSWFWVVYFIQIMNFSGAAGDLYVTCKFSKFPKDILINDTGLEMKVYSGTSI